VDVAVQPTYLCGAPQLHESVASQLGELGELETEAVCYGKSHRLVSSTVGHSIVA
jgi:hypothetical protein